MKHMYMNVNAEMCKHPPRKLHTIKLIKLTHIQSPRTNKEWNGAGMIMEFLTGMNNVDFTEVWSLGVGSAGKTQFCG